MKRKSETGCSVAGTFRSRRYVRNRTRPGRLLNRSTEPDFNRHPRKIPTVIDRAWGTGRSATFKIKKPNLGVCHALKKRICHRVRTASMAAPICDDANLLNLEEAVAEYVR